MEPHLSDARTQSDCSGVLHEDLFLYLTTLHAGIVRFISPPHSLNLLGLTLGLCLGGIYKSPTYICAVTRTYMNNSSIFRHALDNILSRCDI